MQSTCAARCCWFVCLFPSLPLSPLALSQHLAKNQLRGFSLEESVQTLSLARSFSLPIGAVVVGFHRRSNSLPIGWSTLSATNNLCKHMHRFAYAISFSGPIQQRQRDDCRFCLRSDETSEISHVFQMGQTHSLSLMTT